MRHGQDATGPVLTELADKERNALRERESATSEAPSSEFWLHVAKQGEGTGKSGVLPARNTPTLGGGQKNHVGLGSFEKSAVSSPSSRPPAFPASGLLSAAPWCCPSLPTSPGPRGSTQRRTSPHDSTFSPLFFPEPPPRLPFLSPASPRPSAWWPAVSPWDALTWRRDSLSREDGETRHLLRPGRLLHL